jgi:hypothetical protein
VQTLELEETNRQIEALASDAMPDPNEFKPLAELLERAAATGPVPTYWAAYQHACEQLEPLGFAKSFLNDKMRTKRNGVRVYEPKFDVYIAAFRAREVKREAAKAKRRRAA